MKLARNNPRLYNTRWYKYIIGVGCLTVTNLYFCGMKRQCFLINERIEGRQ